MSFPRNKAEEDEAGMLADFYQSDTGIHEQDTDDEGIEVMQRLSQKGIVRYRLNGWWELTDLGHLLVTAIGFACEQECER